MKNKERKAIIKKIDDNQKRISILILKSPLAKIKRIKGSGIIKSNNWPIWSVPPLKNGRINNIKQSKINGWFKIKGFFIII